MALEMFLPTELGTSAASSSSPARQTRLTPCPRGTPSSPFLARVLFMLYFMLLESVSAFTCTELEQLKKKTTP